MLADSVREKANHAIILSGCSKSGASLLGQLIYSMAGVEFSYEPAMMFALFPLLSKIKEAEWRFLYETYLHEEILVKSLAGRSFNFNSSDKSYIYHVKSKKWVSQRFKDSLRRANAERLAERSHIAYKVSDALPFLPQIIRYYPKTHVVVAQRDLVSVIHANLESGRFREDFLQNGHASWPFRIVQNKHVPLWVEPAEEEEWLRLDEINRIAFCFLKMSESVRRIPNAVLIQYQDLVEHPRKTAENLARKLGLKFGDQTEVVMNKIKPQRQQRSNPNILDSLEPRMRQKISHCDNSMQAHTRKASAMMSSPL